MPGLGVSLLGGERVHEARLGFAQLDESVGTGFWVVIAHMAVSGVELWGEN